MAEAVGFEPTICRFIILKLAPFKGLKTLKIQNGETADTCSDTWFFTEFY